MKACNIQPEFSIICRSMTRPHRSVHLSLSPTNQSWPLPLIDSIELATVFAREICNKIMIHISADLVMYLVHYWDAIDQSGPPGLHHTHRFLLTWPNGKRFRLGFQDMFYIKHQMFNWLKFGEFVSLKHISSLHFFPGIFFKGGHSELLLHSGHLSFHCWN